MNDHDRSWLSVKEAAEILGVSSSTVKRRIKQGILQAQKKGKRYLINRSSLERMTDHLNNSDRSLTDQDVRELNSMLRERIRELEADKAYLQERIVALERLLETLTPKALPKPQPPLWGKIKRLLRRS